MTAQVLKKAILPILILIVGFGLMQIMASNKPDPDKETATRQKMLVEVMTLTPQPVRFQVLSQGEVEPKHQTNVVAEVSGRVIEVSPALVAGGFVKKDDVLIRFDDIDYQAQLRSAQANLLQAMTTLEEEKARARVAEEDWRHFSAAETPELGLRKPHLARDKANVEYARALLQQAERDLDRTVVRAPYDGLIRSKHIDLGQFAGKGEMLATIFATEVAEIRLSMTDSDVAVLEHMAQGPIPVTLSAIVAGEQTSWNAHLVRSEGVIDEKSRSIYAVAEVQDPYLRDDANAHRMPLKFGRFVQASVFGEERQELYSIPRSALKRGNQVVVVTTDNKVQWRSMDVVRADADFVYVAEGFEPGERISTTPLPGVLNGTLVRVAGDEPVDDVESEEAIVLQGDM